MKYKKINRNLLKYIKKEKIIDSLFKDENIKRIFFSIMEHHIDKNSHLTFGRILIDHFCEDYKEGRENIADKAILDILYKDIKEPEKENPNETLRRLEIKIC